MNENQKLCAVKERILIEHWKKNNIDDNNLKKEWLMDYYHLIIIMIPIHTD